MSFSEFKAIVCRKKKTEEDVNVLLSHLNLAYPHFAFSARTAISPSVEDNVGFRLKDFHEEQYAAEKTDTSLISSADYG